jgi:aminoglycoside 2''-phosphotransferase
MRVSDKFTRLTDRIRAVYPRLDIHSAELNESGQNNDILLVNGGMIFRFPRYPAALASMHVEAAVLETIQGRVPLPTPKPIFLSLDGRAGGEAFMGYTRLSGVPLLRDEFAAIKNPAVIERIAHQLAGFLQSLHSTPLDHVRAKLPHHDTRAQCMHIYHRIREKLFSHMRPDARQWAEDHYESFLSESANFDYQPVLKHGDFGTTNILFDQQRQTISGVIDFGSTAVGDPAYDFAGLLSSFGENFLVQCAHTYPELDRSLARVRFYQGTFALLEALFGVEHNDQSAFDAGIENYV